MEHLHTHVAAKLFCANQVCFDAAIVQIAAIILLAGATFAIVRPFFK